MKKTLTHFVLAAFMTAVAATVMSSCKLVNEAVPHHKADLAGASVEVIIPPTSETAPQGVMATSDVPVNIDSVIGELTKDLPVRLGVDNIVSARVTSVSMTLDSADLKNNFGNFEYAALTFNSDATPGSATFDLANVDNNPDVYASTLALALQSPDTDLKPYFRSKTTFTYAMIGKLRHATTKPLHCHLDVKYSLELKQ